MEEEFGSYDFDFTRYVIKKVTAEESTLIVDGINEFTMGKLIFEDLKKGYDPDNRMIGGKVFGIKRKTY